LIETNDKEIYEGLVGAAGSEGLEEKQFVTDRVELLLRTYRAYNLHNKVVLLDEICVKQNTDFIQVEDSCLPGAEIQGRTADTRRH
jgi:hypothetical protein